MIKKITGFLFVLNFLFLTYASYILGHDFHVATVQELQNALTAAQSNTEDDYIYLASGTYDVQELSGTLEYIAQSGENFSISIIGSGADNTLLVNNANDTQVLHIETGNDNEWMPSARVTIQKISVLHGNSNGQPGGGLFVQTREADIIMEDCKIKHNKGYSGGGAFLKSVRSGYVTVKRCEIKENEGAGGDLDGGGLFLQGKKVLVDQCTFENNTAISDAFYNRGGGLRAIGSDIRLLNSHFIKNEFKGSWNRFGAGAYLTGDGAFIRVANCTFSNNKNEAGWGEHNEGALGAIGSQVEIFGNSFLSNTTAQVNGAAYIEGGEIYIYDNIFRGNSAGGETGALRVVAGEVDIHDNSFIDNFSGSHGGAMNVVGHSRWKISGKIHDNLFKNNRISSTGDSAGGALVVFNPFGGTLNISIYNNIFLDNRNIANGKAYGGALHVNNGSETVRIFNNVFSNNEASASSRSSYGGNVDLEISNTAEIIFTNNTLFGGTTDWGGGVNVRMHNDASFKAYNNIIWGNSADDGGPDLYIFDDWNNDDVAAKAEIFFNDIGNMGFQKGDNIMRGNNIAAKPQLINPGVGEIHLLNNSPCIDAGSDTAPELPDYDFEGDPRIIGNAPDMGADEAGGSIPPNQPPVIDSFTASPYSGHSPLTVTFTCQAHDPDGHIQQFVLEFGDGNLDSNNTGVFTHIYNNEGTFQATCKAQDDQGSTTNKSIQITVTAHHEPEKGDVSGDGRLDIVDALFVARYALNLPVNNFNADEADVNCDGNVNIVDALLIARKALGLSVHGWCKN